MSEFVSISTAAKRVNISRPRLSKLVKEFKITKIKQGQAYLVDMEQVQSMFQTLSADCRLRKKSIGHQPQNLSSRNDEQRTQLSEELSLLRQDLDKVFQYLQITERHHQPISDLKSFFRLLFSPWK